MKRKEVNSQIRKDINDYWTPELREIVNKKIRKAIFSEVGKFEESEEPKVQQWAHKMVPKVDFTTHVDRYDLKASIRRYMRQQTMLHLGLQSYFPDLYSAQAVFYECPFCRTRKIQKLPEGGYKCKRCRQTFGGAEVKKDDALAQSKDLNTS